MKYRYVYLLMIVMTVWSATSWGQNVSRPPVWGIAKMTFLVSDFDVARSYYGRFLGFDEAFSYQSPLGKVVSFKVSDRQFLEFVEDKQVKDKKRMVSVSIETEDVEAMRVYLKQKGMQVPDKTLIDGAGNEVITVDDGYGNTIEFIRFVPDALHKKSKGKFLSDRRISTAIHHAGLYTALVKDKDPFYVGIMRFNEIIRYPDDRNEAPTMIYMAMGESAEYIEHFASYNPNFCHPCFLTNNIQETVYTLKERRINETLGNPMVGRGNRWILNIQNPDGTGVEFTEPYRVR